MSGVQREPSMNAIQIEQKSYEMPPREGISIAHFLTVADVERSARYYEKVFGARILTMGDGNAPPYLQLANIWMILNVGGGPTPDKPTVTLSVPDPNHINSFMNFRVADIQACYELWKSRGAEFITEPIPKYGEIRCYIRDPDGYIIEVGQSTDAHLRLTTRAGWDTSTIALRSLRFCQFLLRTVARSRHRKEYQMDGTNELKEADARDRACRIEHA